MSSIKILISHLKYTVSLVNRSYSIGVSNLKYSIGAESLKYNINTVNRNYNISIEVIDIDTSNNVFPFTFDFSFS